MVDYLLPALFLAVFIAATYKKIPAYTVFAEGAKGAVPLAVGMLPYTAAVLVLMELMRASGLTAILADFMAPALRVLGIPKELNELLILRPFSGSGSIALLSDIIKAYGADSAAARGAAVMMASGDTVLYVSAVYFSSGTVRRTRYALPVALCVCVLSAVISCLLVKFM
jgi:spore maturation protein B